MTGKGSLSSITLLNDFYTEHTIDFNMKLNAGHID